jgi:hypothetical protein
VIGCVAPADGRLAPLRSRSALAPLPGLVALEFFAWPEQSNPRTQMHYHRIGGEMALAQITQPLRGALLGAAPARGATPQPPYVKQLRADIGRGRAVPVEMTVTILLADVARGGAADDCLRYPRLLTALVERALELRDGKRPLSMEAASHRALREEMESREAQLRALTDRSTPALAAWAKEKREEIDADLEMLRAIEHALHGAAISQAVAS